MRTILIALSLSMTLLAPGESSANDDADAIAAIERFNQDMFAHVAESVVFIAGQDNVGSGFFVSTEGWILTNAHVVNGSNTFDVILNDGRAFVGQVVERGRDDIDFALVKIDVSGVQALRLDDDALRVGTWLGSVGHGLGGAWTYNTGMASNIYPSGSKREVFQTNIPLNPGNSGGPLFNRDGLVVGVVTAGVQNANNVNFGLRVGLALDSLSKLGDHCECWIVETDERLPVFFDGANVGEGPRVVIPVEPGSHEVAVVRKGQRLEKQLRWPADKRVTLR